MSKLMTEHKRLNRLGGTSPCTSKLCTCVRILLILTSAAHEGPTAKLVEVNIRILGKVQSSSEIIFFLEISEILRRPHFRIVEAVAFMEAPIQLHVLTMVLQVPLR